MYCLIDTEWVCFKARGQEQHSFCDSNKNWGLLKLRVSSGGLETCPVEAWGRDEAWGREGVGGVKERGA